MICSKCNSEINDNSNFCPVCGVRFARIAEPVISVPAPQEIDPAEQEINTCANKTLIFGIISLAAPIYGGIPILGIIFGVIAKKQNALFETLTKRANTKALIGSVLGKVGFILGIVNTIVYLLLYIFIFVFYYFFFTNSFV